VSQQAPRPLDGRDDRQGVDVGPVDVGPVDVGPVDVGPVDVGPVDVGPVDVGCVDVGCVDVGYVDVGLVDFAAVFAAQPTAYLVLSSELVILAANEAYLHLLGRTRQELLGRSVFEAFPPAPGTLDEQGRNPLQVSFERARDSGLADQMPLLHYDVTDPASGELVQRFWSLINSPVLDADGRALLVLQRVEDVTDYVTDRRARPAERDRGALWERHVEEVEADLYARAQELRVARDAEAQANRRLAALADVALQLAQAQTVEELTEIIVGRGLAALGADGGALAVPDGTGVLHLSITAGLGTDTQRLYGQVPLDGPLPAAVTARTGERILLPDEQTCLAFGPQMQQVLVDTGCPAWAFLPLSLKEDLLGSLSVGWSTAHPFAAAELELLDALAAQTAHGLARIQSRQAEQAAALAAHRMSETLQRSLLTDPPQPAGLQIAVRYRPAGEQAQVGGDWYDAFPTADGTLCLVIGDVAGHDRNSAAAMGQLRNLLRGIAYTLREPPTAVLTQLDRALRDLAVESLATAVLATVHQSPEQAAAGQRTLRWSNAGHPPPLLIDPDGTARLLETPADLLVGLDPATPRTDHQAVLEPGSTVLLYTDGLVERRHASLDDGLTWLIQVATDLADLSPEQLCDALLKQVSDDAEDDIALLAVRVAAAR